MGDLLNEIQITSQKAADALKQAGFKTDSDIQSLTREDLHELLPGRKDLSLRKDLFDKIKKSRPANMLLKELAELQNNLASSAQIDPGVFIAHIRFINEQLINVLQLCNDNVDLLKNNNTMQQDSKAEEGAVMGDLLKEIQIMSPKAADTMKQAGLETDSDIQSLTREDLNELLPGAKDFKLRKNVFDTIQKSSLLTSLEDLPNDNVDPLKTNNTSQPDSKADKGAVMRDLLKEIQRMSEKAADTMKQAGLETDSDIQSLTREDLNELLPGAKDFKLRKNVFETIQKSSLLTSLEDLPDDNVDPLKNNNTSQPDSKADKGGSNAGTSAHDSQEATVKYKMVVGGRTFGAHTQLMERLNAASIGVTFLENTQDSQIIIVFCPITSRVESDVKAAMTGVPGDKPVILVKMHHVCESKSSLCFNTSIDYRNDVLQVNVFYHENLGGLLQCQLNDTAIYEIQQELLKHSDHRSKDTSPSSSGWGFFDYFLGGQ